MNVSKKEDEDFFKQIHYLLDSLTYIISQTSDNEIYNNFYKNKIENFRQKFKLKKKRKIIERKCVQKELCTIAYWVAACLQDVYLQNCNNKNLQIKIEKLHTKCFIAVKDFKLHTFPFLKNHSPTVSSDSED